MDNVGGSLNWFLYEGHIMLLHCHRHSPVDKNGFCVITQVLGDGSFWILDTVILGIE
jgi:hypothetical protein